MKSFYLSLAVLCVWHAAIVAAAPINTHNNKADEQRKDSCVTSPFCHDDNSSSDGRKSPMISPSGYMPPAAEREAFPEFFTPPPVTVPASLQNDYNALFTSQFLPAKDTAGSPETTVFHPESYKAKLFAPLQKDLTDSTDSIQSTNTAIFSPLAQQVDDPMLEAQHAEYARRQADADEDSDSDDDDDSDDEESDDEESSSDNEDSDSDDDEDDSDEEDSEIRMAPDASSLRYRDPNLTSGSVNGVNAGFMPRKHAFSDDITSKQSEVHPDLEPLQPILSDASMASDDAKSLRSVQSNVFDMSTNDSKELASEAIQISQSMPKMTRQFSHEATKISQSMPKLTRQLSDEATKIVQSMPKLTRQLSHEAEFATRKLSEDSEVAQAINLLTARAKLSPRGATFMLGGNGKKSASSSPTSVSPKSAKAPVPVKGASSLDDEAQIEEKKEEEDKVAELPVAKLKRRAGPMRGPERPDVYDLFGPEAYEYEMRPNVIKRLITAAAMAESSAGTLKNWLQPEKGKALPNIFELQAAMIAVYAPTKGEILHPRNCRLLLEEIGTRWGPEQLQFYVDHLFSFQYGRLDKALRIKGITTEALRSAGMNRRLSK